MKSKWIMALVVAASFGVSGWLSAQTQTGGPAAPAGPGQTVQDLPIPKPSPPAPVQQTPPPAPPPPAEQPGPKFFGEQLNGQNIVFVVDRSGSMDWESKSYTGLDGRPKRGNRMERAKTELIRSIGALTDNFKFNIVAYDCEIVYWRRSGLHKATDGNKNAAFGWIRGVSPDGGTGTGPGVAKGLSLGSGDDKVDLCVLLTDGAPNCTGSWGGSGTTSQHKKIIRDANKQRAKINTYGIGVDSQEFRQFLIDVANETGGKYVDVP